MFATKVVHSWAQSCCVFGLYEAKRRSAQPSFPLVPSLAHTILLSKVGWETWTTTRCTGAAWSLVALSGSPTTGSMWTPAKRGRRCSSRRWPAWPAKVALTRSQSGPWTGPTAMRAWSSEGSVSPSPQLQVACHPRLGSLQSPSSFRPKVWPVSCPSPPPAAIKHSTYIHVIYCIETHPPGQIKPHGYEPLGQGARVRGRQPAAPGERHVRGRGESGTANRELDCIGRRVVIGHSQLASPGSVTCC